MEWTNWPLFTVGRFDLHQAEKQKHTVYLVEFDLIHSGNYLAIK